MTRGTLLILRGIPGAGKTTLAKALRAKIIEADQYHTRFGIYQYDQRKAKNAHTWCQVKTNEALAEGHPLIAVANTFIKWKQVIPYLEMGRTHGYQVHVVTVTKHHTHDNIHGVDWQDVIHYRETFEHKA